MTNAIMGKLYKTVCTGGYMLYVPEGVELAGRREDVLFECRAGSFNPKPRYDGVDLDDIKKAIRGTQKLPSRITHVRDMEVPAALQDYLETLEDARKQARGLTETMNALLAEERSEFGCAMAPVIAVLGGRSARS